MYSSFSRGMARAAEGLAGLAVAGLLGLALLTAADVLMRFLWSAPIRGLSDVTAVAAAVLLSACLPHVVASRGNITIDAVGRQLGPLALRALNVFGAVVSCLAFAVMAWQCTLYALDMYRGGDTMPVLRWPVWPWWSAVALFVAFTALAALATLSARGEAA